MDKTQAQNATALYTGSFQAIEAAFPSAVERGGHQAAGEAAVRQRADAVDDLIRAFWAEISGPTADSAAPARSVALLAVGGYGRRELFPYSDVDLLFLLDSGMPEKLAAEPLRRLNQALWDAGLRISAMTRTLAECEAFDPQNAEAVTAMLDARPLTGDLALARQLTDHTMPRVIGRDGRRIAAALIALTQARHARFGHTLFHLEPNIKECPGGLRDAHLCAWLAQLSSDSTQAGLFADVDEDEFDAARAFMTDVRTYLHLRHRRDENVLDWQSQHEAARAAHTGTQLQAGTEVDAAMWMRLYFRHARVIERCTARSMEDASALRRGMRTAPVRGAVLAVEIRNGDLLFTVPRGTSAAAKGPAVVSPDLALEALTQISLTGARLPPASEELLSDALPALAAQLEDGPALRRSFEAILTGPHAGKALRAMHALGLLELFVPEFHGIDALVIRDAYHRYTVDEHTFVVIDTINALLSHDAVAGASADLPHAAPFAALLRELPTRGLLLMAALLHDTGKGYTAQEGTAHALESARLAERVLRRLQYDQQESALVLDLIRNHLQMSAALRRDVFDQETVRAFTAFAGTPLALRMLTLLTYADISAVHPGALTPWKAENLWLLYEACAAELERNVDEGRQTLESAAPRERVEHVRALVGDLTTALDTFLQGLPRRYLETRSPQQVREHFMMAQRLLESEAAQHDAEVSLTYAPDASEITLVAQDRPLLFALLAGALAAWGMNILTAEAFSNAAGLAVDSVRFTDTYRTLELNDSERRRFVLSLRDVLSGTESVETLLAGRRRQRTAPPKRIIAPRVDIDTQASSYSTIVQVIAQDTPGLLYALALALAAQDLNIEVALIDTEGEMAIDVFYLTQAGRKLEPAAIVAVQTALLEAIASHQL